MLNPCTFVKGKRAPPADRFKPMSIDSSICLPCESRWEREDEICCGNRGARVGLRFELADGTRERLSEAEIDAMCDALWLSDEKGSITVVGKIVHERQRPPVLQKAVKL